MSTEAKAQVNGDEAQVNGDDYSTSPSFPFSFAGFVAYVYIIVIVVM
jgi:hypothetical protein